jgi:hypothetical protein
MSPLEVQRIGDAYVSLADLPAKAVEDYHVLLYNVSTRITFNRWVASHPRISYLKPWATQLTTDLKAELDEQSYWAALKEQKLLGQKPILIDPNPNYKNAERQAAQ